MAQQFVYLYRELDKVEASVGAWDNVRSLLGGKGANLAEMTRLGVPVPPGFTITTAACNAYLAAGEKFPDGMWEQALQALKALESQTGKGFGTPASPLLVSCRSGAKFSMPGMMDTVLNIGLNDETATSLINQTKNARFVYDLYRRLVHMMGSVVFGIDDEEFEHPIEEYKKRKGYRLDTEFTAEDWQAITNSYKEVVKRKKGFDFPQDPYQQLRHVIESVFKSWNGKRAKDYRRAANIADDLGTAVNIVTMVFGNMGDDSCTGVVFTRDPGNGERRLFGDYLVNAQGEDVVAGIRNTEPIDHLAEEMPAVFRELQSTCNRLEQHFKDMQDIEFTVERKKLWMLQTRNGKRTAHAAARIAVEMVTEGLLSKEKALLRVSPDNVDALLHPQFEAKSLETAKREGKFFVRGVNASPGAAVGQVYFDADTAEKMAKEKKQDVIMVRPFTKPDDVHGMLAAKGLLTSEGGATSHAAVVARQFGVPCVAGASELKIDLSARIMRVGNITVREAEWVSVNGTTGEVFVGKLPTAMPVFEEQRELQTLLAWADEVSARNGLRTRADGTPQSGLQVWANADYPPDARRAREYGARGIGLCRTEHMFFEQNRLPTVQRMILAANVEERKKALNELLPHQRSDFEGLFEAMDGLPVIIRLIDPPLHEFLPELEGLIQEVATLRATKSTANLAEKETLLQSVKALHESNPMMGLRGVRLSIVFPELVEMQVRAIFEASANMTARGIQVKPEIMIPLVGHVNELRAIQPRLEEIGRMVMKEKNVTFRYKFGTMIEIPRAALTAGEIAGVAEFFSFGTNDLTQMTFGFSRDDAERGFLLNYVEQGILPTNPFQTIDRDGVGRLIQLCVEEGRKARPTLEVGICGEHGGDPASIELCYEAGLNYVSCSPYRVPIARLAAAHAALKVTKER